MQRVTPTGVYVCNRGVQRVFMPSRTLLVHYIRFTWVLTLFVLKRWLPRAKTGDGQVLIPRFFYVVCLIANLSDIGYRSEHLLLNDGK